MLSIYDLLYLTVPYVKGNMLVDFVAFEWNLENQIVVDTMAQRERERKK